MPRSLRALDTHEAQVDWGDGTSGPAPVDQGAGTVSVRASYRDAEPGGYDMTVTVVDDDGGTDTSVLRVGGERPDRHRHGRRRRADRHRPRRRHVWAGWQRLREGKAGSDQIFGGPGNGRRRGGRGTDVLVGGSGHDRAFGQQGRDTCDAEVRRSCL